MNCTPITRNVSPLTIFSLKRTHWSLWSDSRTSITSLLCDICVINFKMNERRILVGLYFVTFLSTCAYPLPMVMHSVPEPGKVLKIKFLALCSLVENEAYYRNYMFSGNIFENNSLRFDFFVQTRCFFVISLPLVWQWYLFFYSLFVFSKYLSFLRYRFVVVLLWVVRIQDGYWNFNLFPECDGFHSHYLFSGVLNL